MDRKFCSHCMKPVTGLLRCQRRLSKRPFDIEWRRHRATIRLPLEDAEIKMFQKLAATMKETNSVDRHIG